MFTHRQLQRDGYCKVCQDEVKRNEDKVTVFEYYNSRATVIIICDKCVLDMYEKIITDGVRRSAIIREETLL